MEIPLPSSLSPYGVNPDFAILRSSLQVRFFYRTFWGTIPSIDHQHIRSLEAPLPRPPPPQTRSSATAQLLPISYQPWQQGFPPRLCLPRSPATCHSSIFSSWHNKRAGATARHLSDTRLGAAKISGISVRILPQVAVRWCASEVCARRPVSRGLFFGLPRVCWDLADMGEGVGRGDRGELCDRAVSWIWMCAYAPR